MNLSYELTAVNDERDLHRGYSGHVSIFCNTQQKTMWLIQQLQEQQNIIITIYSQQLTVAIEQYCTKTRSRISII